MPAMVLRTSWFLLLGSLLTACLAAAERPDPTASLNPRDLLACLAALRAPLDQQPDDQDLLGRAEMAYLELSFAARPDQQGAAGPWLAYAEELSAKRAKLRGGAPHASLADALPDLWLDAVRGDSVAALAGLERFPADAQSQPALDLRMVVTRDLWAARARWRGQRQPLPTALGGYGYAYCCYQQGLNFDDGILGDPARLDPLTIRTARNIPEGGDAEFVAALRPTYALVCWMLRTARLPDAEVCQHLSDLLTAFGGTAVAGAGRADLATAVDDAIAGFACDRVEPLLAAYRICRTLRSGEQGVFDAKGRHRLVSTADLARWLQDRLFLVAGQQANYLERQGSYTTTAGELCEKAFPGSLLAARTRVGYSGQKEVAKALGPATIRELDDPLGLSPGIALAPFGWYVQICWFDAVPSYLTVARRLWPTTTLTRAWGLTAFCTHSPQWSCRDLVAPVALAAYRRDPYRYALWNFGRYADPSYPLTAIDDLPPTLTRIDAQVDIAAMPLPGTEWKDSIVGRWQGWLLVDATGSVPLAIEADDRARLSIGSGDDGAKDGAKDGASELLMRCGNAGRAERTLKLTPGWHPLSLEWHQGNNKGTMRLLTKAADGTWQVVPADHLAHGDDHQPGLSATYWKDVPWRRIDLPRPADIARLTAYPWLMTDTQALAQAWIDGGKPAEAVNVLRAALARGMPEISLSYEWTRALAAAEDPALGRDLLKAYAARPCCQSQMHYAIKVATTLGRAHLQDDFFTAMAGKEPCCVGGWIFARMAIGRGDLKAALGYLDSFKPDERNQQYWQVRIEQALLRRVVDGHEPEWDELRDWAVDKRLHPSQRLFCAWLTGQKTWETVSARSAEDKDGDELLWYRGLHELTLGNYDTAKGLLSTMAGKHPGWIETADADAVLFWLATQTPEQLAARPKAKPLPAGGDEKATPSNF